MRAFFMP